MHIDQDILAVLSGAILFTSDNTAVITKQLDRATYARVDKVLRACGGKWSRKHRCHDFEERDGRTGQDRIEEAIATGEVTDRKADLAFFPTPEPLAARLAELAGIKYGDVVLEPSAGTGRLVDAALKAGAIEVRCCERDREMRLGLAKRFARANVGAGTGVYISITDDFLDTDWCEVDAVIMNPPFKKIGQGDHLDHVRHAYKALKAGGRLASILPSGVTFRQDRRYREFREFVADRGTIESVPAGSFRESGTDVNTCIVVLER